MAQNSNNNNPKNGFWSRLLKKPIISSLLALLGLTAFINIAKPSLSNNSFSLPEAQLENTNNNEPYKGYSDDIKELNELAELLNHPNKKPMTSLNPTDIPSNESSKQEPYFLALLQLKNKLKKWFLVQI